MNELTFYNKPELKEQLLKETIAHQKLDAFIRGDWLREKIYNGHFKGCFYGCMTQSEENTLSKASDEYGLPLWYVHVTEKIYEELPDDEWKEFPYQAIEVLPVGLDTNKLRSLWNYRMLEDQLRFSKGFPDVKKAIRACMKLFEIPYDQIAESAARSAAESAESAASSAARSAASSSESAARSAAWSAESAARSAAWSASSAEWSARSAASSAAWSAASSAEWSAARSAEWSAARSARSAYYSFLRDLLFKCIKDVT